MIEHMFDQDVGPIGLWPGESVEDLEEALAAEDELAWEVTCRTQADGPSVEDRHHLPDLDSVPAGLFLAAILCSVERERLMPSRSARSSLRCV